MIEPSTLPLPMWVIYDHPLDYPDFYVARCWLVGGENGPGPHWTANVYFDSDLEALRDVMLGMGLGCMPRMEQDEPQIVEVWM